MKLFCKHDYIMKMMRDIAPIDYEYTQKGIVLKSPVKVGCVVCCKKCGKEKKRLGKTIANLYAKSIVEERKVVLDEAVFNITKLPEEFY